MKAMVLGSGGWGTALALLLRDNGHAVSLWSHNPEMPLGRLAASK